MNTVPRWSRLQRRSRDHLGRSNGFGNRNRIDGALAPQAGRLCDVGIDRFTKMITARLVPNQTFLTTDPPSASDPASGLV